MNQNINQKDKKHEDVRNKMAAMSEDEVDDAAKRIKGVFDEGKKMERSRIAKQLKEKTKEMEIQVFDKHIDEVCR